jgi:PAS domain S-box-containing protein
MACDTNLDITELKRTQEPLRDSEGKAHARAAELQAIMDAAPAAIFIAHDPECRRISGNRAAHTLLRQQRGSNLSKSAPDAELPANFRVVRDGVEIPPWELPIQRAALTGLPVQNCEVEVVFEDGTSTDLMGNVEPLFDDNGRPRGAVAVLSDITERKKEELELRKFVSLADNSVEFISMCDMNFMPFYANQAALLLVGLDSLEQASRTPVTEFFFPEDRRFIIEEFFPRVVREGRAEVEIRFRHFKTGKPVWMIYHVFYIKDATGQPVGLATVSRDITERKQAEAALRESEERFRTMADTAPVMLWVSGTDKLCTFFNKPWLGFTGRTMEQEMGNGWATGVHPDDLDRCLAVYSSSFDARRGFQMEYRLRRADGEYRWVLDKGIPRYLEDEFTGFIGSCVDITEQKLIEERLRANATVLRDSQQQLRALAGSLLTAQEDERRRLSRELHDDVTQRLAFLSIELGRLTNRLTKEIPDSLADTRASIRALQDHTIQLSTEVRRLARGLHPSVIEDFGLPVALEEFCDEFEKAQAIEVIFDGLIPDSHLDPSAATCLYRIAQESLRNAVIHGKATKVRVGLSAEPGRMVLRVTDNGVGLSAPGFRAKTGLGVVSMRERIRLVNGTLTLSSQPGLGAEVVASVPVKERELEQDAYSAG